MNFWNLKVYRPRLIFIKRLFDVCNTFPMPMLELQFSHYIRKQSRKRQKNYFAKYIIARNHSIILHQNMIHMISDVHKHF